MIFFNDDSFFGEHAIRSKFILYSNERKKVTQYCDKFIYMDIYILLSPVIRLVIRLFNLNAKKSEV